MAIRDERRPVLPPLYRAPLRRLLHLGLGQRARLCHTPFIAREGLVKKLLIASVILAALTGCTRADDSRRVLEQSGYSQVEITGWRPFAAGHDDTFSTGFRAKAPNGQTVTGAVTSGFLKGSTIRLD
jgi:hypothetical protein